MTRPLSVAAPQPVRPSVLLSTWAGAGVLTLVGLFSGGPTVLFTEIASVALVVIASALVMVAWHGLRGSAWAWLTLLGSRQDPRAVQAGLAFFLRLGVVSAAVGSVVAVAVWSREGTSHALETWLYGLGLALVSVGARVSLSGPPPPEEGWSSVDWGTVLGIIGLVVGWALLAGQSTVSALIGYEVWLLM